jgi:hypothetical protein
VRVRPKIAARGAIAPFIVMEVPRAANDRAAAGHDVLHREVGQPSAAAPLYGFGSERVETGTWQQQA